MACSSPQRGGAWNMLDQDGSKTGLMSDVFWHSEPVGVDFFGPKWRQTIWKLKIRQLRWAALKHSGCWVVLKLLHSLIFFILGIDQHPMNSDPACVHRCFSLRQPTAVASGGRGSIFCEIFLGILGIPGQPARWDLLGRNVDSAARKWTRHLDWRLRFYKILHFERPP